MKSEGTYLRKMFPLGFFQTFKDPYVGPSFSVRKGSRKKHLLKHTEETFVKGVKLMSSHTKIKEKISLEETFVFLIKVGLKDLQPFLLENFPYW